MPSTDVTQKYSRVAAVYDAWTRFTESRSLEAARDKSGIRDGRRDSRSPGCTGVTFREALRRNPSGRNVGERCGWAASTMSKLRRRYVPSA